MSSIATRVSSHLRSTFLKWTSAHLAAPPSGLRIALEGEAAAVFWDGVAGETYDLRVDDGSRGSGKTLRNAAQGTRIPIQAELQRVRVRRVAGGAGRSAWSLPVWFDLATGADGEPELRTRKARHATPWPQKFYDNVEDIYGTIIDRGTELSSFPLAVSLILEGRGCNYKCFYCSHIIKDAHMLLGPQNTFTKGYTFDDGEVLRIDRVAGETVGAPPALIADLERNLPKMCVVMFGGSEPLLYPEFEQVVKVTQKYPHVRCSVCTNGSLLTEDLATYMTNSNFLWVRISIDGATARTFKKIRKGKLDKVIRNIKRLTDLRGNARWPRLQLNFVVCRSNYHEIPLLLDLAADLKVSKVNFKMLISHQGHFKDAFVDEDPLTDRGICAEVLELVDEAAAKAAKLNIAMTKEAVSPAIFARYPELADPKVRAQVLVEEASAIAERARRRDEEPEDDPGPRPLAEFAEGLDERLLVAAGGQYYGKSAEEVCAMTARWEEQREKEAEARQVTEAAAEQATKTDAGARMVDALIEDEDGMEDEEPCGPPAKSGFVPWKKVFCHQPFSNLSVGHNRAKFCCYARPEYTVFYAGDDLTIQDIWNNPKFQEARQNMFEGEAEKVCKPTCPHLRHGGFKNAFVSELAEERGTKDRM